MEGITSDLPLRRNPPNNESAKVAFRLLEMFDFRCFDYGDNQGIEEEKAKRVLIKNKEEIFAMELPPTSYLGLLAGAFNFLTEDQKMESK